MKTSIRNTEETVVPVRSRPRAVEQLAVAVLPSVLVVLALLLASASPQLAPVGLAEAPFELLGFALVGALAAQHRAFSVGPTPAAESPVRTSTVSLGLGTIVLPAVAVRQGAVAAALCAFLALSLAEVVYRAMVRRTGAEVSTGRAAAVLERAVLLAFVTLLAGGASIHPRLLSAAGLGSWAWAAGGAAIYAAAYGAAVWGLSRLRRHSFEPRPVMLPATVDAAGWLVGGGLTGLAVSVGWSRTFWVWPVLALLATEAARNALLRGRAHLRLGTFERLQEAHERILSETSGMGGIAQQVLVECRNILPVRWFQFELPEDDGYWQSWAAGPDGLLVEGRPKPPARPDMLPGIHRSARWRVLERSLVKTEDGHEETLARLRLWCDPRRIEAGAEDLFATLLPQMASSVHRARLDREAKLDPLTGVPVRRVLESRLQRAYRKTCDEGEPLAVIMCDIDHFKRVNDTYGHAAGDEALKQVAATLERQRRDEDLCCRYGGEEFTVLLEHTDGEKALRLAERLRHGVEDLHFVFEGQHIPLTLSLGVAAFPELHVKTASELLLLADEALYAAKEAGRNRSLLNIGRGAYRPA